MTQEEKAKRYDGALHAAKAWHNTFVNTKEDKNLKQLLETIFPELKESEEEMVEKIRKDIISYLNNRQITSIAESSATERWLAWLEKQGANSVSVTKANTSITNAEDVEQKPSLRERYDNIAKSEWFKKTHEGMSVSDEESKWTDDDEQYLLVCKNALRKYQVSDKWDADIISKWLDDKLKQGEQKPKWTEKDEDNLNMAIYFMRSENTPYSPTDVEPVVEWLCGLKQRMEE